MSKQMKLRQRIYGIILLVICTIIVAMAIQGRTPEEQDITFVLFLAPLAISLIHGKKKWLYDLPGDHGVQMASHTVNHTGGVGNVGTTYKITIYPHMGGN